MLSNKQLQVLEDDVEIPPLPQGNFCVFQKKRLGTPKWDEGNVA